MPDTVLPVVAEACCERFERAWRDGNPLPIGDCLPEPEHTAFLATLEELVIIDMDFRARAGSAPRVEDYVARFPALNRREILHRLLREEFRARRRGGETITPAEYDARFPDLTRTPNFGETPLASTHGGRKVSIPGFEILGELGAGGMGAVYRARDTRLNRVVALKVIHRSGDSALVARFRSEAETVATLRHPNIVQIHEVGEHDGLPWFSQELIAGGTLAAAIRREPQPAQPAARIVETLARAVGHAHQNGIIHRDLKPSNVLLDRVAPLPAGSEQTTSICDPNIIVKVADFGLAKRLEGGEALTEAGAVMGTPAYMAPEQASPNQSVGPAADVYALGAILYELLTGRPPFQGTSAAEVWFQLRTADPVPPTQLVPRVPRDLETICLKCLQKDPNRRYATADELASDLHRFLEGHVILARPASAWERSVKWVRRNPTAVVLISTFLVAATVLAGGGIVYNLQITQARDKTDQALKDVTTAHDDKDKALKEATAARDEARLSLLYLNGITRADRAWWANHISRSTELLADTPAGHRDWEWYYQTGRHRGPRYRISSAYWVAADRTGKLMVIAEQNEPGEGDFDTAAAPRPMRTGPSVLNIHDPETGKLVRRLGAVTNLHSLAVSPDGRFVAAATSESKKPNAARRFGPWDNYAVVAHIWNVTTGEKITTHGTPLKILALAFSPNGDRLALACCPDADSGTIRAIDPVTGKLLVEHKLKNTCPLDIAFDRTGELLATRNVDPSNRAYSVVTWDAKTGAEKFRVGDNFSSQVVFAFHPTEDVLIVSPAEARIELWDTKTGTRHPANGTSSGGSIQAIGIASEGPLVTVVHIWGGPARSEVRVWDAPPGPRRLWEIDGSIGSLAFVADGRFLALCTTGRGAEMQVRELADELHSYQLPGLFGSETPEGLPSTGGGEARIGFAGARLLVTDGGRRVVSFDVVSRTVRESLDLSSLDLAEYPFGSRATLPPREKLAVGSRDPFYATVYEVPPRANRPVIKPKDQPGTVLAPPTGWELRCEELGPGNRPKALAVLDKEPERIALVVGRVAVVAGGKVRVWDVRSGEELWSGPNLGSGRTQPIRFSPDGTLLAVWQRPYIVRGNEPIEEKVHVHDAATGQLAVFCHNKRITCCAFHPNGAQIAWIDTDGTFILWNAKTGAVVRTLPLSEKKLLAAVFTPDGRRLITGNEDGAVEVWNPVTGTPLLRIPTPNKAIRALELSADGTMLATAGADGTVRLFTAPGYIPRPVDR